MRVDTLQEAVEGAPALIVLDEEGQPIHVLITDDDLLSVASDMARENGWTHDERDKLYEAMVTFIDRLAAED